MKKQIVGGRCCCQIAWMWSVQKQFFLAINKIFSHTYQTQEVHIAATGCKPDLLL